MFAGASVRPVVPVVVALVAGPGVTSPKNRLSGCETVTLASSRSFVSSRALDRSAAETIRVSQQLSVDGVADVSLQRPQRFAFGLPFGDLAVEVDATLLWVWPISVTAAMWIAAFKTRFLAPRQPVRDAAARGELDRRRTRLETGAPTLRPRMAAGLFR